MEFLKGHSNIGVFQIREELGSGAESVVYRAEYNANSYAIKLQRKENDSLKQRLWQESIVLARARHKSLPEIYEVGEHEQQVYVAMSFIDGQTLAQRINKSLLSLREALIVIRSIASALIRVHQLGLVHRDIKPSNILFDKDGRVFLIDFGLAQNSEQIVERQDVIGSIAYASPEQTRILKRPVDGRSDLYSLGVVLFESLTGRRPFKSTELSELLQQISTETPPALHTLNHEVNIVISLITAKLLSKDPDQRYQSAASLLADLERIDELNRQYEKDSNIVLDAHSGATALYAIQGRQRTLENLCQHWSGVNSSKNGRAIVLTANSGMGKSYLSEAFIEYIWQDKPLVLTGKCVKDDPNPFAVLQSGLRTWIKHVQRLPESERLQHQEHFQKAAGEAAPYLRAWYGPLVALLPVQDDEGSANDTDNFSEVLSDFLLRLSRRYGRAVLWVDDVQWVDGGTRDLLCRLQSNIHNLPLLLYIVGRKEAMIPGSVPDWLIQKPDEHIILEPLGPEGVKDLIASELSIQPETVPQELFDSLYSRVDGSPMAVNEYLNALFDAHHLKPHWGEWLFEVKGLEQLALGADVTSWLVKRIDRIPEEYQTVLSAAALLGNSFELRWLYFIADEETVKTALNLALQARLIQANGSEYRLVHDKVREALIASLDERERRKAHGIFARAMMDVVLQKTKTLDSDELAYAGAQHFFDAFEEDQLQKIFEANLHAAGVAKARYSFERAYHFLQQALLVAEKAKIELEASIYHFCGVMGQRIHRIDESIEYFKKSLTCKPNDKEKVDIHYELARIYIGQIETASAKYHMDQALITLGHSYPRNNIFFILGSLVYWLKGVWLRRPFWKAKKDETDKFDWRIRKISEIYPFVTYLAILEFDALSLWQGILRGGYYTRLFAPCRQHVFWCSNTSGAVATIGFNRLANAFIAEAEASAKAMKDPESSARIWPAKYVAVDYANKPVEAGNISNIIVNQHISWIEADVFLNWSALVQLNFFLRGHIEKAWSNTELCLLAVKKSSTGRQSNPQSLGHSFRCFQATIMAARGDVESAKEIIIEYKKNIDNFPSDKLRHNVYYGSLILFYLETGNLGPQADKAIEDYKKLNLRIWQLPGFARFVYVFIAYIRVLQYRRALGTSKARAAHRLARNALAELKKAAVHPTYKALRWVIEALYWTTQNNMAQTELCWNKAEQLANKHDIVWVHYEVLCQRARVLRSQQHEAAANRFANLALKLAQMHGWVQRVRLLSTEFDLVNNRDMDEYKFSFTGSGTTSMSHSGHLQTSRVVDLNSRRQLDALMRVGMAANQSLDPQQQAQAVLDEIIRVLGAERAFLFVGEPDALVLEMGRDAHGQALDQNTAYSKASVKKVADTQTAFLYTGGFDQGIDAQSSILVQDLRSILAAPLRLRERFIGVLYVDSRLASGLFSNEDVTILEVLAQHVALALESRSAMELQINIKAERAQLVLAEQLSSLSRALSESLDLLEVLSAFLEHLQPLLPYRNASVLWVDEHEFKLLACKGMEIDLHTVVPPEYHASIESLMHHDAPQILSPQTRVWPFTDIAEDIKSQLLIPLSINNQPIGVLILGREALSTQTDIGIAAAVLSQAMHALNNARQYTKVQTLANIDTLTQVATRGYFMDLAESEYRRALRARRPLGACMLDIDHFKRINDTYGHACGDIVLTEVARRLKNEVRESDILGRYGGEEFALCLSETEPTGARNFAERLRTSIANTPIKTESGELFVTISIGVIIDEQLMNNTFATLLEQADQALYQAKQTGRNQVVFNIREEKKVGS